MTIKFDNVEFNCYNFEEINEGKNFSLKIDLPTNEEKDALIKLLTKKYLAFTKENGETIKVTVNNNSHSYSLRDGQTEPDEYHFSIDLEKFDREAEIKKLIEEVENSYAAGFVATDFSVALKELLIEKGIITNEEFPPKLIQWKQNQGN